MPSFNLIRAAEHFFWPAPMALCSAPVLGNLECKEWDEDALLSAIFRMSEFGAWISPRPAAPVSCAC